MRSNSLCCQPSVTFSILQHRCTCAAAVARTSISIYSRHASAIDAAIVHAFAIHFVPLQLASTSLSEDNDFRHSSAAPLCTTRPPNGSDRSDLKQFRECAFCKRRAICRGHVAGISMLRTHAQRCLEFAIRFCAVLRGVQSMHHPLVSCSPVWVLVLLGR